MDNFFYYRRQAQGIPLLEELRAITPWYYAESIIVNAHIAVERLMKGGQFVEFLRGDSFVETKRRQYCRSNSIYLYETYFDLKLLPFVTFISFAWDGTNAIGLSVGQRNRLMNISRLSGYPYLNSALTRLAEEFGKPFDSFIWSLENTD